MSLVHTHGKLDLFHDCVAAARVDLEKPDAEMKNRVKPLYDAFIFEQLSAEISKLLTPDNLNAEFSAVFQTTENLRKCCPDHTGDWYFTGNYPTPGGNRVVNRALLNYVDKINQRAY
jgi:amidophosphoribosyltransferase